MYDSQLAAVFGLESTIEVDVLKAQQIDSAMIQQLRAIRKRFH